MPTTEDEIDNLLPDYCEIRPCLCDLCQNEHPEWREAIERAMIAIDPAWSERSRSGEPGIGYPHNHLTWVEYCRLWGLRDVPCLVFEYDDCVAAICRDHLRKILEAMDRATEPANP